MRRAAHWSRLALLVCLLWTGPAFGAELLLRESLLQAQRDRVTVTITAVVDHLGAEAHPLGEDCDLHVPLRSQLDQELAVTASEVLGPYVQISRGSTWAVDDGQWEFNSLLACASGIRAGTSEILRNILSERVLGLPKD